MNKINVEKVIDYTKVLKDNEVLQDMDKILRNENTNLKLEIERLNNIINEMLKKIQFYKTTEWGLRGYGILENFENILNGGDVKSDR